VGAVHRQRFLPRIIATFVIFEILAAASCGKSSPTSPTSAGVTVTAVSPGAGTTLGGTVVTITGAKFAAGATVTIGGAAATNVAVVSDTSLTATTPQHASGLADVVVAVSGKSGTLRSGYSYAAPAQADNQPPVIASLTELGTRRSEPKLFADLDEDVNVTATVTDAETPVDQLDYQWSAAAGSLSGTGAAVRWHAPHAAGNVDITLAVVEHYQGIDASGLPVTKENKTTKTITVAVHDSSGEVGDMATTFLLEFSRQSPSPSEILRNFSDACSGKRAELSDVTNNQNRYVIQSYRIDPAQVKVSFNGVCDNTDHGARNGDACAYVPSTWHSLDKTTNKTETATGTDQVNATYDGSRWWLCNSDFFGKTTNPITTTTASGMVPGAVR